MSVTNFIPQLGLLPISVKCEPLLLDASKFVFTVAHTFRLSQNGCAGDRQTCQQLVLDIWSCKCLFCLVQNRNKEKQQINKKVLVQFFSTINIHLLGHLQHLLHSNLHNPPHTHRHTLTGRISWLITNKKSFLGTITYENTFTGTISGLITRKKIFTCTIFG